MGKVTYAIVVVMAVVVVLEWGKVGRANRNGGKVTYAIVAVMAVVVVLEWGKAVRANRNVGMSSL